MNRLWLAARVLVLGVATSALGAPFQNGSFELGTLTGDPCNTSLPNGSTAITGWQVISGDIDYLTPSCWTASDGTRSLDLVGTGSIGGVRQIFETIPGQTYQVIFDLAGNPGAGFPPVKNLTVTADGTPHSYTYDTSFKTTTNMGWIANSFLFVAGTSSTTLDFVSDMTGSTFAGAALDNVRVARVSPIVDTWSGGPANVYSGFRPSYVTPTAPPSPSPLTPTVCSGTGQNWSAAGGPSAYPLTVSSNGTQGTVVASYNVPTHANNGACGSWTTTATASSSGDVNVLWDYRGDHASFHTTVDLRAFVIRGGSVVQSDYVVSGRDGTKFQFSGSYAFHVQSGDTYGFTMTGSNADFIDALRGTLTTVVVAPAPAALATTTTLQSSLNPSAAGSSVTLTATVTGDNPTGTVQFTDGGSIIAGCVAPVALSGAGNARTAECTTSSFEVGIRVIVASYGGDAGNVSSQSAQLGQVVNPAAVVATPWVVGAVNVINGSTGQPIGSLPSVVSDGTAGTNAVFTYATINDYCCHTGDWTFETTATTTGDVTRNWTYTGYHGTCQAQASLTAFIRRGGVEVYSAPLYSASDAGCNGAPPAGGFGQYGQAVFAGVTAGDTYGFRMHSYNFDSNGGVLGRLTVTTGSAPTTTMGGWTSANPVPYGASVQLMTIVTGSAPDGTVTFTQEGRIILGCDAVPMIAGFASCWTVLPQGSLNIVALYTGDTVNAGSVSPASLETINPGPPTASFVVNSTVDSMDAMDVMPGDGICADSLNRCTLRAAIIEANALSGATTITVPAGTYVLSVGAIAIGTTGIPGSVTINGAGAASTIVDGANSDRVFMVTSGVVTISGLTVRNGQTNNGNAGAGIVNSASLTLNQVVVSTNTSDGDGGGIFNQGTLLALNNSTVSGNVGGGGAGIYSFDSMLTLINSTISGNDSINIGQCGFGGGGIWVYAGQATITNSTLFDNLAECAPGAGGRGDAIASTGATVTIRNSILASPAPSGSACYGTVISLGGNIADDGTCGFFAGDLVNTDPQLGPLANNGGPTPTHLPLPGSPAVNAVPIANCATALDQRGVARPQGPACDIGAVERAAAAPVLAATTTALAGLPNPATVGGNVTFTATVTTLSPGSNPTGTVRFVNGVPDIVGCSAVPLAGTGDSRTAVCTTSSLTVGSWLISALYSGDGNNQSSNGATTEVITAVVPPPPLAAPTLVRVIATNSNEAYLIGRADGAPGASITFNAYAAGTCNAGALVGGGSIGTFTTTTDAAGYFAATIPVISGNFVTVQLTAPAATPASACTASSGDNDFWPKALTIVDGAPSPRDFLDAAGKARWYKFDVAPGQKIKVTLSGLPADYDLAVFKDINQAFASQLVVTGTASLTKLSAEFAPSTFSPSTFSPSTFSPSTFSPDAYAPSTFSPSTFSPSLYSPSTFSPSTFSPSTFSPSTFSPSTFSPSTFSPSTFSPSTFSPSTFSPADALNLDATQVAKAFSSAQTRSIIGVSASPGTGDESVFVNTWNDTGSFYVRVSGRGGAFSTTGEFTLNVTKSATTCGPVTNPVLSPRPAATGSGRETIILTDSTRVAGDSAALLAKLSALAGSVAGVVIDLKNDTRVLAYRAQAETYANCPYAKNLLAQEIKSIVDGYRASNPGLRYVVIAGNDNVVPFFRYPDESLLGQESAYVPPVATTSASDASLRQDFVLSQDAYGSSTSISMRGIDFPIPELAVGRLVETSVEIGRVIDAFLASGTVAPTSSLVTGYDFLADAADAVTTELQAGIGSSPQRLVTASGVSPESADSWTATDLRSALLDNRHDVIFLAGHFSANSALAADFTTSLLTTDLAASTTNFTNSIVFSAGCHSGYNIVDGDAIDGVTLKLDWPQAFAQKGATLIAGTGYQYGDTEFVEYSERLYKNFARQLRAGTTGTAIAVGEALVKAKLDYLTATPEIRGIHQKALLEATVFGLPMLGVDMPAGRDPNPATPGVIDTFSPSTLAAGAAGTLGLRIAPLSVTPSLSASSLCLKNPPYGAGSPGVPPAPCPIGTYTEATWLTGANGVTSNPAEPVLPLQIVNVTPTTDVVLRGVGFVGGTYTESNVIPLTGAPTTELRGVHTPFLSPVFYPMRLSTPNYFGALSASGGTRLLVTPAQHRAADVASGTSTRRAFTNLELRLYYSGNTTATALSTAPTIVSIAAASDATGVTFTAQVLGDPAAAIHDVWVTYTGDSGPGGAWTSLSLTQCSVTLPATTPPAVCGTTVDSQKWMGVLPPQSVGLKYVVQAVNGVGLVSADDNLGAFYSVSGIAGGPQPPGGTQPVATTLTLVSPPASGTYGGTVPVTATLGSATVSTSGKLVTFSLGSGSQSGVTDANGRVTADLPVSPLPGANYLLKASFGGDQDLLGSSASTSGFVVNRAPSNLASPAPLGATLTGTFGISSQPIDGSVKFLLTSPTRPPVTVWAITDYLGRATLPPPGLAPGEYTVVEASFDGNAAYSPSTRTLAQTISIPQGNQTINFAALANKTFGDPDFAVTATTTSSLAASFAAAGTCTVAGASVHIVGAGGCTITASQAGNLDFNPAAAVPRSFTIAPAGSTTVLTASPTSVALGQPVTLTATVTTTPAAAGIPAATSVTFQEGPTALGGAVAVAGGTAALTTSTLTLGGHVVSARYGGDANVASSTGIANVTVGAIPTTTVLTADRASPAPFGTMITLTATMTPVTATGTVTFMDGATTLGIATAVAAPAVSPTTPATTTRATLAISTLGVGTHTLTAVYAGNGTNGGSTSAPLGMVIGQGYASTSPMLQARANHTATLLNDGRVLVTGGYTAANGVGIRSAEIHCPNPYTPPATPVRTPTQWCPNGLGNFSQAGRGNIAAIGVGNMVQARAEHTATLLPDGTVLIVGGFDQNKGKTDTAEIYDPTDPAADRFTAVGKLHGKSAGHAATLITKDGKPFVLVTGGGDKTGDLYDPVAKTFKDVGDIKGERTNHTSTLVGAKVLLAGGADNAGRVNQTTSLYDIATAKFSTGPTMLSKREHHTATLLPNGKVLLAGGRIDSGKNFVLALSPLAEIYDPANATTPFVGVPFASGTGRYAHGATALIGATGLPDGRVLVTGGTGVATCSQIAGSELFAVSAFTAGASLVASRSDHAAAVLKDGRVLITGGTGVVGAGCGPLNSAEIWNGAPPP